MTASHFDFIRAFESVAEAGYTFASARLRLSRHRLFFDPVGENIMPSSCASRLFPLVAVLVVLSLPLAAQRISGDITGDVTDATGAFLPNVSVKVESSATGL